MQCWLRGASEQNVLIPFAHGGPLNVNCHCKRVCKRNTSHIERFREKVKNSLIPDGEVYSPNCNSNTHSPIFCPSLFSYICAPKLGPNISCTHLLANRECESLHNTLKNNRHNVLEDLALLKVMKTAWFLLHKAHFRTTLESRSRRSRCRFPSFQNLFTYLTSKDFKFHVSIIFFIS